jgi:hypothetical protein
MGSRASRGSPGRSIGPRYVQEVKAKFWRVLHAASAADACGALSWGKLMGASWRKGLDGTIMLLDPGL